MIEFTIYSNENTTHHNNTLALIDVALNTLSMTCKMKEPCIDKVNTIANLDTIVKQTIGRKNRAITVIPTYQEVRTTTICNACTIPTGL